MRRNGWVSCLTWSGSRTGPPFSTTSCARLSFDRGRDADPAARLVVADGVVDQVLDHAGEQRLAARDPRVRTAVAARRRSPMAEIVSAWRSIARRASSASETVDSSPSGPCWVWARVRKLSSSRSTWSSSRRSRSASVRMCGGTGPGLAIATSSEVRIPASGVRSSCEALATNWRSNANERSRRSSSWSKVSASSFSSSSGPVEVQTLVQVGGGDLPGGRRDRAQRPQEPPGHQPTDGERAPRP